MLCEWHIIFNEGLEVLAVCHHVLYRLLPQTQVTLRMSLQLISKSPEQTVPVSRHLSQFKPQSLKLVGEADKLLSIVSSRRSVLLVFGQSSPGRPLVSLPL